MSQIKRIYKRNTIITSEDLNKDFLVYQGLDFFKVTVSKEMLGRKFGEYVFTRRLFKFKQKSNVKK
jgi:ribosomal protein S19